MPTPAQNWNARREPRQGLMLHYSAGSYESTVSWCRTAKSGVSYNRVIRWDGHVESVAPDDARAWHAGVCRPSAPHFTYADANSAFEGIALAGGPAYGPPTAAAVDALVRLLGARMDANGWPRTDAAWRITSHHLEAWPRGRKQDVGDWLDLDAVRRRVAGGAP